MLAVVASFVLAGSAISEQERAAVLLGEVWARYAAAPSLDGTLRTHIFENGRQISTIDTRLSFVREGAGRIFIKQEYWKLSDPAGTREEYLVTGDGQYLSYNMPFQTFNREEHQHRRLTEEIGGTDASVGGQYAIVVNSIKDRSVPLDIAIGRDADLEVLKKTWGEIRLVEDATAPDGAKVIVGKFALYPESGYIGDFRMVVSEQNDLLMYETQLVWLIEGMHIPVRTVYEVDLKVGANIPPERFKVIR